MRKSMQWALRLGISVAFMQAVCGNMCEDMLQTALNTTWQLARRLAENWPVNITRVHVCRVQGAARSTSLCRF